MLRTASLRSRHLDPRFDLSDLIHPAQDSTPAMLDGVGITPQPEVDPPAPESVVLDSPIASEPPVDFSVERLFIRAYALVSAALLTSAAVASQVPATPNEDLVSHQATIQIAFIFEIACVAVLSRYVPKLPQALALVLLFVCAAVNGASFCVFVMWVPVAAIGYGFFICAVAFAATAAISFWRKIDLSAPQGILMLFGVGIAVISVANASLRLDVNCWGTSFTAFVLFAALASYYCNDIADLDLEFEDDLSGWKSATCGALILYLNFINLYLLATRLFGQISSSSDSRQRRIRP